jgi:hypothetical protein
MRSGMPLSVNEDGTVNLYAAHLREEVYKIDRDWEEDSDASVAASRYRDLLAKIIKKEEG